MGVADKAGEPPTQHLLRRRPGRRRSPSPACARRCRRNYNRLARWTTQAAARATMTVLTAKAVRDKRKPIKISIIIIVTVTGSPGVGNLHRQNALVSMHYGKAYGLEVSFFQVVVESHQGRHHSRLDRSLKSTFVNWVHSSGVPRHCNSVFHLRAGYHNPRRKGTQIRASRAIFFISRYGH